MMKTACGTPGYVAPEILKGQKYGKGVDVWSLGVITYILLCGFPPFYDQNNSELFKQIKAGAYDFPSPYWDNVSEDAKNCIRRMLTVDPSKRITMAQLLEDKWLESDEVSSRELYFQDRDEEVQRKEEAAAGHKSRRSARPLSKNGPKRVNVTDEMAWRVCVMIYSHPLPKINI